MTRVVVDREALSAFVDEHGPAHLERMGDRVAELARTRADRSEHPGRHGHAADSIRASEPERDGDDWRVRIAPADWGFYLTIREVTGHPALRPALDQVVGESS